MPSVVCTYRGKNETFLDPDLELFIHPGRLRPTRLHRYSGLSPASRCGDGVCSTSESAASCPQDCPATTFSGKIKTTTIISEGSDIAVMVASPQVPRYPEGAGIVVVASPIFTPTRRLYHRSRPHFAWAGPGQLPVARRNRPPHRGQEHRHIRLWRRTFRQYPAGCDSLCRQPHGR